MNTLDERRAAGARRNVAGVIFDVDGTLTRTNDLIFASFNYVARKYCGRHFTPPEIIAFFGPPEEGALVRIVGEESLGPAMDDLCNFYRDNHSAMAGLHDGIEETLVHLREQGIPLAVFTGKGRRTTLITLETLGIDGYFDLIVSGSDVLRHKPHPEGIRQVLDRFALLPSDVLMVGDSLGDITAARGAGVTPVAALWDSYDRQRVVGASPDYSFERVMDLDAWFRTEVRYPAGAAEGM
jgi:pyrophosphatase PpaX